MRWPVIQRSSSETNTATAGTLDELESHFVVHDSTRLDAERPAFEYRDGERYRDKPMPTAGRCHAGSAR